MIELKGSPEALWDYEQAFASHIIIKMARDLPSLRETEQCWARIFGTYPDNKVTYKVHNDESMTDYYVTFHDNSVYVGTDVRPYRGRELPPHNTVKTV